MKAAQVLCLLALAGFGSSAYAAMINVLITFDGESGGGTQTATIGDYVFDQVAITPSANCNDDPGPDECINFTVGDSFTLSRTDNEDFTLASFWFEFQGNNGVFTVTGNPVQTFAESVYGQVGTTVTNGNQYSLDAAASLVFASTGVANIRLDDFGLVYDDGGNGNGTGECVPPQVGTYPDCTDPEQPPEPPVTPVPEPGTLGLLGLGLLGMALRRRRTA